MENTTKFGQKETTKVQRDSSGSKRLSRDKPTGTLCNIYFDAQGKLLQVEKPQAITTT